MKPTNPKTPARPAWRRYIPGSPMANSGEPMRLTRATRIQPWLIYSWGVVLRPPENNTLLRRELTRRRRLAAISVPPLKRYNNRDDIRETLLAGMLLRLIQLV